MTKVLLVLINNVVIYAYLLKQEDMAQLDAIRSQVQERALEEAPLHISKMLDVRLQVVDIATPACSPDGWVSSLVEDILDGLDLFATAYAKFQAYLTPFLTYVITSKPSK